MVIQDGHKVIKVKTGAFFIIKDSQHTFPLHRHISTLRFLLISLINRAVLKSGEAHNLW